MIPYRSWAEKILIYATFISRVRPPGVFSYGDYRDFLLGPPPRKDAFDRAIKRLLGYGFVATQQNGRYNITVKGNDAVRRIAKRNVSVRGNLHDDDYDSFC